MVPHSIPTTCLAATLPVPAVPGPDHLLALDRGSGRCPMAGLSIQVADHHR